jgi:hypothetical protein
MSYLEIWFLKFMNQTHLGFLFFFVFIIEKENHKQLCQPCSLHMKNNNTMIFYVKYHVFKRFVMFDGLYYYYL